MKKIFAFVAAAMMFVGCNSSEKCVVKGTIEGFAGQVAVMDMNGEMILGLATVMEGAFDMDIESDAKELGIGMLTMNQNPISPIFFDGESINVEGNIYGGIIISGTVANDAYVEYIAASQEFAQTLPEDFTPENATPEVIDSISAFMMEQFQKNKDNYLGAFLIVTGNVPVTTPQEMMDCINGMGKDVQQLAIVQELKVAVEQALAAENEAAAEENAE